MVEVKVARQPEFFAAPRERLPRAGYFECIQAPARRAGKQLFSHHLYIPSSVRPKLPKGHAPRGVAWQSGRYRDDSCDSRASACLAMPRAAFRLVLSGRSSTMKRLPASCPERNECLLEFCAVPCLGQHRRVVVLVEIVVVHCFSLKGAK